MAETRIEWTDSVWNPVTGCTKVSAGCTYCYAERMSKRLAGRFGYPADEPFRVTLHYDRVDEPLWWRKPRRVFVNSMGDLFHKDVPDEFIDQVFGVMAATPDHTYQVLTKRSNRMLAYFERAASGASREQLIYDEARLLLGGSLAFWTWPLPNVWLGVSVENQQAADERIPLLLQTPAAVRFVSCEPLLGPVDLSTLRDGSWYDSEGATWYDALMGHAYYGSDGRLGLSAGPRLDWVICGGETGPGARPMHPDWARSLRDQCQAAGVPFFFKSWGDVWVCERWGECKGDANRDLKLGYDLCRCDGPGPLPGGHKLRDRSLDGQEWNQMPEVARA